MINNLFDHLQQEIREGSEDSTTIQITIQFHQCNTQMQPFMNLLNQKQSFEYFLQLNCHLQIGKKISKIFKYMLWTLYKNQPSKDLKKNLNPRTLQDIGKLNHVSRTNSRLEQMQLEINTNLLNKNISKGQSLDGKQDNQLERKCGMRIIVVTFKVFQKMYFKQGYFPLIKSKLSYLFSQILRWKMLQFVFNANATVNQNVNI
ncbi:unnamed protein product [Paramecium octaurelia]|uniref:Uncharacterized protein n=1 Tax=Paramecium octaurelia TaxID=43137 RepID=A0A8S1WCB0_PAROT|nr:unnamed protein product [Paramecium octaurelia]